MSERSRRARAIALWEEGHERHMKGEVETAIGLYSTSISIYPTAEAHTFRGWAYSFMDRFEEAIAECRKAIALDPTFGNPYNDIGSYLMKLGKLDEAIQWLEKAKKAPRYEPRHYPFMNLGRLYAKKGWLLQALREFDEALSLRPGEESCVAAHRQIRVSVH